MLIRAFRRWWLRVRIRALEDEIADIGDEILDAGVAGDHQLARDLDALRASFDRECTQLYNRLARLK